MRGIIVKPCMMILVKIVSLVRFPVDNKSYSSSISHELVLIGSIIFMLSSDMLIDDLNSNVPDFDVIVILYLPIP